MRELSPQYTRYGYRRIQAFLERGLSSRRKLGEGGLVEQRWRNLLHEPALNESAITRRPAVRQREARKRQKWGLEERRLEAGSCSSWGRRARLYARLMR